MSPTSNGSTISRTSPRAMASSFRPTGPCSSRPSRCHSITGTQADGPCWPAAAGCGRCPHPWSRPSKRSSSRSRGHRRRGRSFSGFRSSARSCSWNASSPSTRRSRESKDNSRAIRMPDMGRVRSPGPTASIAKCCRPRWFSGCPCSGATPSARCRRSIRSSRRSTGSWPTRATRFGRRCRTPSRSSNGPMSFTSSQSIDWSWHGSWRSPNGSSSGSAAVTCCG
jgi:hypothetical protein